MIQPLDPGRRGMQQSWLLAHHQDGVEPTNRLKFYKILAETIVAGIHDLFEFRDHGFRTAVDDRKNPDRLAAHPVEVEAERGIQRRCACRPPPLHVTPRS